MRKLIKVKQAGKLKRLAKFTTPADEAIAKQKILMKKYFLQKYPSSWNCSVKNSNNDAFSEELLTNLNMIKEKNIFSCSFSIKAITQKEEQNWTLQGHTSGKAVY